MAKICKTIKIEDPDKKGDFLVINEEDYDSKIHKIVKEKDSPVEETTEDAPEEVSIESIDDLGKLTKQQLIKLAEEYQVSVSTGDNKAALVESLADALFAKDEDGEE